MIKKKEFIKNAKTEPTPNCAKTEPTPNCEKKEPTPN